MHLARLVESKVVGKFLSSQEESEVVSSIVSEMNLSDLNSVVSQVVVDNVREFFKLAVESENLKIVVQELFLALNSSTS